jgi:hypothetical protein
MQKICSKIKFIIAFKPFTFTVRMSVYQSILVDLHGQRKVRKP